MNQQTEPKRMQRRGIERRQAILDAAVQILATEGYEAATLKAMGDLAGIPVASMYHYFPDRLQVEVELMQAWIPQLNARIDNAMADARLTSLADGVEAIIAPILACFAEHPACAELWFVGRHPALAAIVAEFHDQSARKLWQWLLEHQALRAGTPALPVQIAFEAGNHLFDLAFRRPPQDRATILTEARRMVISYLSLYAP